MIYRMDELPQETLDSSWRVLTITCSMDHPVMVGPDANGIYSIRVSRLLKSDWYTSVGDFIGYCESNGLNGVLLISETDYADAKHRYDGHTFDEPILRADEPIVLIHSTDTYAWERIRHERKLKSWNMLKNEGIISEQKPIGAILGDPPEFSEYIMFGNGVSGEIVVSSKLSHSINMDVNAEYHPGARLYFDAQAMAQDGLLVSDGCHIKVKNEMPLDPYLIWVATWDNIGLQKPVSTPKIFAQKADRMFAERADFRKKTHASQLRKET